MPALSACQAGVLTVIPNGEFNDLWMRFVSIVGMYAAELESLPPGETPGTPGGGTGSRRRSFLQTLTPHGQGLAWFAAPDLAEVQQSIELLSDLELQSAFDAKNPWQLILNVAGRELGARPNVARGHTRAESGGIIIRWLANRRARLLRPRCVNILKHEDICEGRTAASLNKKATVYPTDSDLVTACEQWLGVTGTQEAELREETALQEPIPSLKPRCRKTNSGIRPPDRCRTTS